MRADVSSHVVLLGSYCYYREEKNSRAKWLEWILHHIVKVTNVHDTTF